MATITLGKPPKNFAPVTVNVTMPDGTEGTIKCTFKYRTVTAYGAFKDELAKESGFADTASVTWTQIMEKRRDKGGEYLMHILDSWDMEGGLSQSIAQQLCDELPGVSISISNAYHAAATEGRLGN